MGPNDAKAPKLPKASLSTRSSLAEFYHVLLNDDHESVRIASLASMGLILPMLEQRAANDWSQALLTSFGEALKHPDEKTARAALTALEIARRSHSQEAAKQTISQSDQSFLSKLNEVETSAESRDFDLAEFSKLFDRDDSEDAILETLESLPKSLDDSVLTRLAELVFSKGSLEAKLAITSHFSSFSSPELGEQWLDRALSEGDEEISMIALDQVLEVSSPVTALSLLLRMLEVEPLTLLRIEAAAAVEQLSHAYLKTELEGRPDTTEILQLFARCLVAICRDPDPMVRRQAPKVLVDLRQILPLLPRTKASRPWPWVVMTAAAAAALLVSLSLTTTHDMEFSELTYALDYHPGTLVRSSRGNSRVGDMATPQPVDPNDLAADVVSFRERLRDGDEIDPINQSLKIITKVEQETYLYVFCLEEDTKIGHLLFPVIDSRAEPSQGRIVDRNPLPSGAFVTVVTGAGSHLLVPKVKGPVTLHSFLSRAPIFDSSSLMSESGADLYARVKLLAKKHSWDPINSQSHQSSLWVQGFGSAQRRRMLIEVYRSQQAIVAQSLSLNCRPREKRQKD